MNQYSIYKSEKSKNWILLLHGYGQDKESLNCLFHSLKKNYNVININLPISNKFKFDSCYDAKLSNFTEDEIYQAIIPSEYPQILSKKYSLVLSREKYKINKQNNIIIDNNSVDAISKYANVICVDGSQVYAYCPVRLELNEKKLGKIYLPLLLVLKPSMNEFADAIANYINTKNTYAYDSFKEIVSASASG